MAPYSEGAGKPQRIKLVFTLFFLVLLWASWSLQTNTEDWIGSSYAPGKFTGLVGCPETVQQHMESPEGKNEVLDVVTSRYNKEKLSLERKISEGAAENKRAQALSSSLEQAVRRSLLAEYEYDLSVLEPSSFIPDAYESVRRSVYQECSSTWRTYSHGFARLGLWIFLASIVGLVWTNFRYIKVPFISIYRINAENWQHRRLLRAKKLFDEGIYTEEEYQKILKRLKS